VMMSEAHRASRSPATRMSPQARRRPWMLVPLVVITIAFVGFALFPYVTLDPGRSRIPVPSPIHPASFLIAPIWHPGGSTGGIPLRATSLTLPTPP
jgi:hypothetical protein